MKARTRAFSEVTPLSRLLVLKLNFIAVRTALLNFETFRHRGILLQCHDGDSESKSPQATEISPLKLPTNFSKALFNGRANGVPVITERTPLRTEHRDEFPLRNRIIGNRLTGSVKYIAVFERIRRPAAAPKNRGLVQVALMSADSLPIPMNSIFCGWERLPPVNPLHRGVNTV
jgi:hypothetical protein